MSAPASEHADRALLLSARSVSLARAGRSLLQDLDLDVRRGERWCVLGPNGSGKSTLLQTLAGLRTPSRGSVRLAGLPYAELGPRRAARHRGLLLQGRSFAFGGSVRDSVMLGRHAHLGRFDWPGAADHAGVDAALAAMDLQAIAERDVLSLSGGEQQRTHIATVLAQDPALFLLDEPTTHLDLKHQAGLFSHLRRLCEEQARAVVFATHDLSVAAMFATHALLFCGEGAVRLGLRDELLEPGLLSSVFGFPLTSLATGDGTAFVPRW